MQVKKFEAPTIQEALETIKRELGPEAVILQTKKNKRGFGLLSKSSVEVTAAVSERSLLKKNLVEKKVPDARDKMQKLPADKQADTIDKYSEKYLDRVASSTQDQVSLSRKGSTAQSKRAPAGASSALAPGDRPVTTKRYIDIEDDEAQSASMRDDDAEPVVAKRRPPAGAAAGKLSLGAGVPNRAPQSEANRMSVEDEVRHLKRMIQEIKDAQELSVGGSGAQALDRGANGLNTPVLQNAFEELVINGVDRRFALPLLRKVAFELGERAQAPEAVGDQLAAEIMESVEVSSILNQVQAAKDSGQVGPSIVALIGPTGVGKTTTVAKIAAAALLKKSFRVGLINLDNYKVAAFDQLGAYAKILNVPFRSVGTSEDLRAAIQDFHLLDLVLVDTTGRSQKDPASLKEMGDILSTVPGLTSHLVLSVTTRDNELYDMATRFAIFRPRGLIVSKLDEASIYGVIYNLSQKVKLPFVYFTTGQRVPEDIEEASPERVAALVLDI